MAGVQRCPYCLWAIGADDSVNSCPDCQNRYHAECWTENLGCATFGCPVWARRDHYANTGIVPTSVEGGGTPIATAAPVTEVARAALVVDHEVTDSMPATPSIMQFCDQCGQPLSPGDRFCISCGAAVETLE
jgi:hypothetical protein